MPIAAHVTESVQTESQWLVVGLADVVTAFVPAARVEALAEAAALSPASVHQRLWGSGFTASCCLGASSLAQMMDGVRERLGADLTDAHLMGLWSLAYEPEPEVIADLAASSDVRLGVIADETPLFRAAFAAYLPEVEGLVEASWFSFESGLSTDDPRFYESIAVGHGLGAPPIFVASTAAQRGAASTAGWQVATDVGTAVRAGARLA